MLYCKVQCYTLHSISLHFTSTALHCISQPFSITALHCISLNGAVFYILLTSTSVQCTFLHGAVHFSILYPIIMYFTALNSGLHCQPFLIIMICIKNNYSSVMLVPVRFLVESHWFVEVFFLHWAVGALGVLHCKELAVTTSQLSQPSLTPLSVDDWVDCN